MSLAYIRKTYGVPAKRGARVRFTPDTRDKPHDGRIMSASGQYLRVKLEGYTRPCLCHPTWQLEYL
jgi:hypothetical protein